MLTYLNKNSIVAYMPVPSFTGNLFFTVQFCDADQTDRLKNFFGLWAVQLSESPLPPQWLAAFALSSIGKGDHEFDVYCPAIKTAVERMVPKKFYSGNERESLRVVGIFSIMLPVARHLLKDPALTAKQLADTQQQFAVITELYRREKNLGEMDDIKIALRVHGSSMEYDRNPFRINYRGDFLPQFIMYYNTATKLKLQESNHGTDTQRTY